MKHLNVLRKIASRSTHKTFKHSSLVMRGGAILAYGYNHDNIHAEVAALNQLWPNKRIGTTVVNIRIRRSGTLGNSKPCPECLGLLFNAGCSKIIFSNGEGGFSIIPLSTRNHLKGYAVRK